MTDELESSIYIYFITADRPVRNAFAGTGAQRRRSTVLTRTLAEFLHDKLAINYTWTQYGVTVERRDVVDLINAVLWSIPDDVAKASGNRTSASEGSIKAIANALFLALDMEYVRKYESMNHLDPASPRYINRPA